MPKQTLIERIAVLLTLLAGIVLLIAIADEGSPAVARMEVAATPLKSDFTSIVVTGGGLWQAAAVYNAAGDLAWRSISG